MTFQTDILTDIDVIFDTDEFANSATWYSKATGTTSSAFACIIGDSLLHGNLYTDEVEDEQIELAAKTTDIANVKKYDTITVNSITYEVINDAVLDHVNSGQSVLFLVRPLNNPTRI